MKTEFPGLKPFYFWKKLPFTQWTVSERQFIYSEIVPYYGGLPQTHEHVFTSAEQWMMWKKAKLMGDHETADKILKWTDPRTVKDLGRKVEGFNQSLWDSKKLSIVYDGNCLKFSQNPELAKLLKQKVLDGYYFVEASPFDTVLGIGISPEDAKAGKTWRGENLLGIALTNVAIDLIKGDLLCMYQEDVNYSCVPVTDALEAYLSKFIDTNNFVVKDIIENDFANLVDNFIEENFGIGEFRHHH